MLQVEEQDLDEETLELRSRALDRNIRDGHFNELSPKQMGEMIDLGLAIDFSAIGVDMDYFSRQVESIQRQADKGDLFQARRELDRFYRTLCGGYEAIKSTLRTQGLRVDRGLQVVPHLMVELLDATSSTGQALSNRFYVHHYDERRTK